LKSHICPWWLAYTFDHRLRRLVHHPEKLFSEYVKPGMTVVDVGCGLGFNALGLAELVGATGRVVAVDIQQEMLDGLMKRAQKKGLADRITPHLARQDDLALNVDARFVLGFYVVHEVPDPARFIFQVADNLGDGGLFMMIEPPFHVSKKRFEESIRLIESSGLVLENRHRIPFGRVAVLKKSA
jgi:cyclopropane fatty-acyl-phospholipid synthase-like methyltransferase